MALESRLELKLSQRLVLTPQLQMAIKLLQMPQLELSQTINQELIENPFLEELSDVTSLEELTNDEKEALVEIPEEIDDAELSLEKLAYLSSDDYFEERNSDGRDLGYFTSGNVTHPSLEYFLSTAADLFDHLIWQLRLSKESEEIREIAELIIGNIDENGYLRITEEEISDISKSEIEMTRKALALVQSFDPPGIAARDVRECLQLQLKSMNMQGTLAESLVINALDLIGKRKYQQLAKEYNVSVEDILAAVKIIEGLDPKPAKKFSSSSTDYITPDVFILKTDGGYQIILNDEGLPKIKISNYYQRLLKQKDAISAEESQFLEDKLRSAVWLLKSLDQRNKTIYRVTESILVFQRDFFDKGINVLKPLNLKSIASELNLHESTISRATSNKYLSCPRGIYSFKYFFSNAIPSDSGELSSTSVKEMIKTIISEEDTGNPLSDMRIVDIFKSKNITLARRTIAKYRDELKIRSQSQRRRQ